MCPARKVVWARGGKQRTDEAQLDLTWDFVTRKADVRCAVNAWLDFFMSERFVLNQCEDKEKDAGQRLCVRLSILGSIVKDREVATNQLAVRARRSVWQWRRKVDE